MTAPACFRTSSRLFGDAIGPWAVAEQLLAGKADPRALEAGGVQVGRVVALRVRSRRCRGGIVDVRAGHRGQQDRRIAHGARHRAGRVLRVRDRDDAGSAQQPDRRLHAHQRAMIRRRDDRAVRLASDARGCQARGNGGTSPRAGSRCVAIEHVRVATKAAASRPAAGGPRRSEVRPFAQVRLSEDDSARLAQSRDDERVDRGDGAVERERPGGGGHPARDGDVVLHQDRNAVQRSPDLARLALGIERGGLGARVGVGLDHRPERGSLPVDRRDAREVLLGQRLDVSCPEAIRCCRSSMVSSFSSKSADWGLSPDRSASRGLSPGRADDRGQSPTGVVKANADWGQSPIASAAPSAP